MELRKIESEEEREREARPIESLGACFWDRQNFSKNLTFCPAENTELYGINWVKIRNQIIYLHVANLPLVIFIEKIIEWKDVGIFCDWLIAWSRNYFLENFSIEISIVSLTLVF